MVRIVIADDHELIRVGVKKIIRPARDIKVVGEATDTPQALERVRAEQPDLLVLDISLPGCEGLEGLLEVRRQFPALPVLMLSMYPEERYAIAAIKAGAAGYINKSMAAEELVSAIHKIVGGSSYVSPRLAELLAEDVRQPADNVAPHERLTAREREVASLIGAGKPVKQVAAELAISVSSVNTYRARIFRKMGLRSNAALIRYAVVKGLVD
jgi:two-component system, NarL family, invasion response regulator UvrY